MRSFRTSLAIAVVLAVAAGAGACGVSASDVPQRLGDAYKLAPLPDAVDPPRPTAGSPSGLVLDFLDAAVGGGASAVNQVKAFFTEEGGKAWKGPDKDSNDITIVRLRHDPVAGVNQCRPTGACGYHVDVTYQVVGTLVDSGWVEPATSPQGGAMQFWVVAPGPSGQLRIDSLTGAPPGLVLRDQALNNVPPGLRLGDQEQAQGGNYYRQQAIYFWDTTNSFLVPDIRYVPLTIAPEQRATKMLGWLQRGPSPQLQGAVNPWPALAAPSSPGVTSRGSTLVVKLNNQAGGHGAEDVRRLVMQLQASLLPSTGSDLEVSIGDTVAPSYGASDYRRYELSSQLRLPIQKYDIVGGQVVPTQSDTNGPAPDLPMLKAKVNKDVVNKDVLAAAIDRKDELAAFVRKGPTLDIVRADGTVRVVPFQPGSSCSRPAWLPGVNVLLIACGGGLYSVASDGTKGPVKTNGLSDVSSVSISPDGRRVALIADGQVTVSALTVATRGTSVSLEGKPQDLVVDPSLVAAGVAWESEHLIFIAGASGTTPALWLVTADGAIATDYTATLKGQVPTDVVAFPRGAFTGPGEAIVQVNAGAYRVATPEAARDSTHNPFYVD
jgi:hypothetical protein